MLELLQEQDGVYISIPTELPNLSNATPESLADDLGALKDLMRHAETLQKYMRSAFIARVTHTDDDNILHLDEPKGSGDKYGWTLRLQSRRSLNIEQYVTRISEKYGIPTDALEELQAKCQNVTTFPVLTLKEKK